MALHVVTPLLEAPELSRRRHHKVLLKMDNLQPSGSFKIRGIGHMAQQMVAEGKSHLVSSSGGNAGLATAYVGRELGLPTTVVVPTTTLPSTRAKIAAYGATVVVHGGVWDEADVHARSICSADSTAAYVPPFDAPLIWSGNASLVAELAAALPATPEARPAAIIVAVGGGGLLCGVMEGLQKCGWDDVPVVAMETEGAASLHAAVNAGKLVTIAAVTSIAKTLGARTVCAEALAWTQRRPVSCHTVSDRAAVAAILQFADEHRVLVEPACGAALAALYDDAAFAAASHAWAGRSGPIVVVVCGGSGVSPALLCSWKEEFGL